MNRFRIIPNNSWFTIPTTNIRQRGVFTSKSTNAYYHSEYHGGDTERRETIGTVENIITTLKNQFQDKTKEVLLQAANKLVEILKNDLPQILQETGKDSLTICAIPRAKAENTYSSSQLLLKQAISIVSKKTSGFNDGTDYIIRHTNTRTTHLDRSGYGGDGDLPYPGITKKTCTISSDVKGKDILLIDDLYTESISIDEDAIQALYDNGANSVVFYSLGKTAPKS